MSEENTAADIVVKVMVITETDLVAVIESTDQDDLHTFHVAAPERLGETAEEFVAGMNEKRTAVLAARDVVSQASQALRVANAGEAKETAAWKAYLTKWCKAIGLKKGEFRRFVTTFNGEQMIIVLSQPQEGVYGCAYAKVG